LDRLGTEVSEEPKAITCKIRGIMFLVTLAYSTLKFCGEIGAVIHINTDVKHKICHEHSFFAHTKRFAYMKKLCQNLNHSNM
jgi:hypothetical protein